MNRRIHLFGLIVVFIAGCAHIPRESVELSATVGRDLAVVYKAHRELARILFSRMRHDINRFVDDVYTPYQIREVMIRQRELAKSRDPDDRKKSLIFAIDAAFGADASPELQESVLAGMGSMIEKINERSESMRRELLDPLDDQEEEVLGSIDRAYQQLHYANSIVTGHLSSVVSVHDTQAELLQAIGVDRDLRTEVGDIMARAAGRIGELVEAAGKAEAGMDRAEENAGKIREALRELTENLKATPQEE